MHSAAVLRIVDCTAVNINRLVSAKSLRICIAACLLSGCASAPIQEMSDARQSLQAAHAAGAETHAPAVMQQAQQSLSAAEESLAHHAYGSAKNEATTAKQAAVTARSVAESMRRAEATVAEADALGLVDEPTAELMGQAKDKAATVGEAEQGAHMADDITKRLRQRVNQYYIDKARPLIEEATLLRHAMDADQTVRLTDAEKAYQLNHGKTAYEEVSSLIADVNKVKESNTTPKPPPQPMAMPANSMHYTVAAGDTLWSIAARPEIYGNASYWPLIYAANRDKINDADLIHKGQVLIIDPNPSEQAVRDAVAHARAREHWSIGVVEDIDKAYLKQYDKQ